MRKIFNPRSVFVLLLLAASCTTEKNTFMTRHFHNLTAHYNGYFWGKLSYEEGLQKLNSTHKDDYSDILPVYVYAESQEVQSIYPEMDRAIKKATTMIENHTITDKNKHEIPDAVKYIKYCYLLMAQAKLYKNEYLSAIDALDYTSRMYKSTDVKYEAMIWQARVFNQMGAVSRAEELIDYLKSNKSLPKKLYTQVAAVSADYYMRTGQWDEVAKWLEKAASTEKKKKVRARYYFILAQLAAKSGDMQKAFTYYSNVLRMHPTYDLEFEATINRALLYMGTGKENQSIKKELTKMLKPTKNIDNRDQIYYALAQIAAKEGDTALCITYLNKSVRATTTNQRQKAMSYLSLADFNFLWEEYVKSKKYFDSTLISLPKKYKGRDSIVAKRDNLQKLVKYIDIIAFQDSVQKLAKMDRKALDKYIDDMISQAREAEEEKKRQEAEAQTTPSGPNTTTATTSNGKWYFYNPGALMQGVTEFNQKWGSRPLEDNWRRSHKAMEATQTGPGETTTKGAETEKGKNGKPVIDSSNNKYNRAYYLKNLPLTDAKMKKSTDSLIDAYYNAGAIYKEYLHNYRKSSADFEELLQRFPDNKYKLPVYYELYIIYKLVGNTERMNYYKNILLTQYPTTVYARLISDPDKYQRDIEANKQAALNLYSATLDAYKKSNYALVLNNCHAADSLYPKSDMSPKFAYLEAIAIGANQGLQAYKDALTKVTVMYPKDSVKFLAQSMLDYLNRKPVPKPANNDSNKVVYSTATDTAYFWIMLVDNKESQKVNDVRIKLTDMNSKTFSQSNLQMDEIFLNTNQLMVVMKKFATADLAKNYYQFVKGDDDIFKSLSPSSYQCFYISQQNFRLMFGHKKADEYLQFFKDKLL